MKKQNLLLLHGALGTKSQFSPLIPHLSDEFLIHSLDFEGHGSSQIKSRPFRRAYFVENVIEYLDTHSLENIYIFGYSMGGLIALDLARLHPELVNRTFTLATKFQWTPEIAKKETDFLNPETIEKKVPKFAQMLKQRHGVSDWRLLLEKTKELYINMINDADYLFEELKKIPQPTRIGLGDRDQMVTAEESIKAYQSLPKGELQIFPSSSHFLEKISMKNLSSSIINFFIKSN